MYLKTGEILMESSLFSSLLEARYIPAMYLIRVRVRVRVRV